MQEWLGWVGSALLLGFSVSDGVFFDVFLSLRVMFRLFFLSSLGWRSYDGGDPAFTHGSAGGGRGWPSTRPWPAGLGLILRASRWLALRPVGGLGVCRSAHPATVELWRRPLATTVIPIHVVLPCMGPWTCLRLG